MTKAETLPFIEASILRPILAYLDERGVQIDRHMERARIPVELVESGGWLSKLQVYRFIVDVVRREACPEVVFAAYSEFQLSDLGPIADAMSATSTVKASLNAFCRLGGESFEGNKMWSAEDGDQVWLCNRVTDDVGEGHEYAQHGSLMVLLGIIRGYAEDNWRTRSIRLQAPKTEALRKTEGLQDCEVLFDQDCTAVAFPRILLSRRPFHEGTSGPNEPRIPFDLVKDRSFAASLERLIGEHLPHAGSPSLNDVAIMSGTSSRTIKRRLNEEGTTFRGLVDHVRFEAARQMLEEAEVSVAEIARKLDYSGANNFIRAFKRMAGVTPTEFRLETTGERSCHE